MNSSDGARDRVKWRDAGNFMGIFLEGSDNLPMQICKARKGKGGGGDRGYFVRERERAL